MLRILALLTFALPLLFIGVARADGPVAPVVTVDGITLSVPSGDGGGVSDSVLLGVPAGFGGAAPSMNGCLVLTVPPGDGGGTVPSC